MTLVISVCRVLRWAIAVSFIVGSLEIVRIVAGSLKLTHPPSSEGSSTRRFASVGNRERPCFTLIVAASLRGGRMLPQAPS